MMLILCGMGGFAMSCSSSEDDTVEDNLWGETGLVYTRNASKRDASTIIRRFNRNGIKLQILDITERFEQAYYLEERVPVSRINVENLPFSIQEIAESWGASALTIVFNFDYKGEHLYDFRNMLSNSYFNIYDEKGERRDITYEQLKSDAKDIRCILVMNVEVVKDALNAPNYLVGIWQNDWQHLVDYDHQKATVSLYANLPFTITEVMNLSEDGTGYLRTIKEYKDGKKDIALDPFRYELTDYHGGNEYGYHGYFYKCYFEAGDVIEYLGRSYDGMQTLVGGRSLVNYPWFKQASDSYQSLTVNMGKKYGTPTKDNNSPIVGRWKGYIANDKHRTVIWVFRSDNTGYRMLNGQHNESFAYTIDYNGTKAEVTIYKYNTGFTVEDGFAKSARDLTFDPTLVPTGKTISASIKGNTLYLEEWGDYEREE